MLQERERKLENIALYAKNEYVPEERITIKKGKNINIIHPSYIDPNESTKLYVRVSKVFQRAEITVEPLGIEIIEEEARPSEMIEIHIKSFKEKRIKEIEVSAHELG